MRLSQRYPVPAEFGLLYEFVNSLDERRFAHDGVTHPGGDELATVPQLEAWMRLRGLLGQGVRLDPKAHRSALELRQSLRDLLQFDPADRHRKPALLARVNAAAAEYPLMVQLTPRGPAGLRPLAGARSGGLGSVLAEVQLASDTGRLDRIKMCDAEECRWVFFDRSKPATRRWCSSALCGNRAKTRAYRERQQS